MEVLLEIAFEGEVIEWRGPAPYMCVAIPVLHVGEVRWAAREASYGWGVVPVDARIAGVDFRTSLIPRGEAYLLPVKVAVQRAAQIALGDVVDVEMRVTRSAGPERREE